MRLLVMLAVALTPTIGYSQAPVITGAVNAASLAQDQPLSPGSLVSLFGTGLADSTATASTVPLPDSIAGVSVTFSGITAPLQFVSRGQINLQVPWRVERGITDIVVTLRGQTSAAFSAHVEPVSPGIFTIPSGSRQALAINSDGSIAAAGSIPGVRTAEASVGNTLMILATGLGLVTPAITDGAASSDQVRTTVATPTVLVCGSPALVTFSGLSPQFVGVNQINIVVPAGAWGPSGGGGGECPIQIELGGIRSSDEVTIAVLGKWDY
jgi:uncharacterized protein (TIGR03437 family)